MNSRTYAATHTSQPRSLRLFECVLDHAPSVLNRLSKTTQRVEGRLVLLREVNLVHFDQAWLL